MRRSAFPPLRTAGPAAVLLALAFACSSEPPPVSEVQRGTQLFASTALSPSSLNVFSCATCHDPVPMPNAPWIKTGAPLAGATLRTSFWGGQENDLLQSINDCRSQFMNANAPLLASDPDAEALYSYLVSLEPGDSSSFPFTVEATISDVPRGDATHGLTLFDETCAYCHGTMHNGNGRLSTIIPVLPEDTIAAHSQFSAEGQRLVFIEKVRHGGFFGYGGNMPPYALEILGDSDVSDLLEALGVLGM